MYGHCISTLLVIRKGGILGLCRERRSEIWKTRFYLLDLSQLFLTSKLGGDSHSEIHVHMKLCSQVKQNANYPLRKACMKVPTIQGYSFSSLPEGHKNNCNLIK